MEAPDARALQTRFEVLASLYGWSQRRLLELQAQAAAAQTSTLDGDDAWPAADATSPPSAALPPRLSAAIGSAVTVRRRSRRGSRVAPLFFDGDEAAGEAAGAWTSPASGGSLPGFESPFPSATASGVRNRSSGFEVAASARAGPGLDVGGDSEDADWLGAVASDGAGAAAGPDAELSTSFRRLSFTRGDSSEVGSAATACGAGGGEDAGVNEDGAASWSPPPAFVGVEEPGEGGASSRGSAGVALSPLSSPPVASRPSLGGSYRGYRLSLAMVEECASPVMEGADASRRVSLLRRSSGGNDTAAVPVDDGEDEEDEEEEDEEEDEEEEDIVIAARRDVTRAAAVTASSSGSDEDEDDIVLTPRRRNVGPVLTVASSSEEEDLPVGGAGDRPRVRTYREFEASAPPLPASTRAFGGYMSSPAAKRPPPSLQPAAAAAPPAWEQPAPAPAPAPAAKRTQKKAEPKKEAQQGGARAASPSGLRDGDKHPVTGRVYIVEEAEAQAGGGQRWGIGGPASASASPSASKHYFKSTAQREALTAALFSEYNATVLGGRLPAALAIEWNPRLLRTAGLTYTSLVKVADEMAPGGYRVEHRARLELSTKVLDTPLKLATTLLHELCHAAAWVVDHVNKPPHGHCFKAWAARATAAYPGRAVTTCHSFEIHHKYQYACADAVSCGTTYGRHSKSIDLERQRCGKCGGRLLFLGTFRPDGTPSRRRQAAGSQDEAAGGSSGGLPRLQLDDGEDDDDGGSLDWLGGGSSSVEGSVISGGGGGAAAATAGGRAEKRRAPASPSSPSAYQTFLATHRAAVVAANPGLPPAQVLKRLAAMWQQYKAGGLVESGEAAAAGAPASSSSSSSSSSGAPAFFPASPGRRLGEALISSSSSSSDGEDDRHPPPRSAIRAATAAAPPTIDLLDDDEDEQMAAWGLR